MNALKVIGIVIAIVTLHPGETYSQTKKSEAEELPVQYRRGIELQRGYQTYKEKYSGENLEEIKRSLFPLEGTGVWTELNPKVPRVDYIGVDFINPDTGWAVGLWGAAIKTTNGGESWTTLETPTGEILLKVHSYNGQVIIVVGHNGTILRSSDGGESFTSLTGITTQELWGVKMLNDTLGWICGRNQTLLKTTDAGLTWQPVVTGYNYHYWQFDFLTEDYFMIACSQGRVLKTTNGGQSFTQHQAGNTQDLYTIDIIDSAEGGLHIAAAGNFGKNVYSSDGGVTWTENQYTALSINWIQYINMDTGYITIGTISSFYKTTNRGQSWFNPGFGAAGEWQFEILNENLGYGVGVGLKVTKTEDGFITGRNLFLNVDFRDVFFFNETTGYALSWFLYKTTNGGLSWVRNENAPGGYDIIFLDTLTGFIGGSNLFKTTNGGERWYQVNGVPGGVGKIFFINPLIGWATSGRNILKTTDGGENWFVQFIHINDSFTSIFFVDSLNGWATSRYVHQTTDGGVNWIQRTDIQIFLTDDVFFSNPDTGWIAKYSYINNSLFRTNDGGLNWIEIPDVIGARKFYFFPDPIHWLTIGFSRYYITNDFGNSWIEFTEDVPTGLISFYAPTNNLGYAGGNQGLILKYNDTSYVPVELISFIVRSENNRVILEWITASEINNYGFEVQRTMDNGILETIGFVLGKGTTTEKNYYSFIDDFIQNGTISYRLKQIDLNGEYKFSDIVDINFKQPLSFVLNQNFPNPFNPITKITFEIPSKSSVKIILYDITGRKLKNLINQELEPGSYTIPFNSENYSSGIYFYRMTTSNGYTAVKKLTIIK